MSSTAACSIFLHWHGLGRPQKPASQKQGAGRRHFQSRKWLKLGIETLPSQPGLASTTVPASGGGLALVPLGVGSLQLLVSRRGGPSPPRRAAPLGGSAATPAQWPSPASSARALPASVLFRWFQVRRGSIRHSRRSWWRGAPLSAIPGWKCNGRHQGFAGNGDHDRYSLWAGPPRLDRMPRLPKGQSGGKGRVCGAPGHLEPAGEPPQDRKRLLNSPGHSVLSPNLLQSFSGEVGSLSWFPCRRLALTVAVRVFRPRVHLPAAQGLERRATPCASARPRGSGSGRKGRIGRGVRGRAGRAALEAPARRAPAPVETLGHRGPHLPSCRFAAPLHPDSTAAPLWVQPVYLRSFLAEMLRPVARVLPRSWPKALLPANLNHTQWQTDFFVTGFLPCRVHFESFLNMVSSLSSR